MFDCVVAVCFSLVVSLLPDPDPTSCSAAIRLRRALSKLDLTGTLDPVVGGAGIISVVVVVVVVSFVDSFFAFELVEWLLFEDDDNDSPAFTFV